MFDIITDDQLREGSTVSLMTKYSFDMFGLYTYGRILMIASEDYLSESKIPSRPIRCKVTMTNFKRKNYLSSLFGYYIEDGIISLENGFDFHLFEERLQLKDTCDRDYLNAVTDRDYLNAMKDRDYRKERPGGELVNEGNNYGDTSAFYVPGIIRRSEDMIKRDLEIYADKRNLPGKKVYLAWREIRTITAECDGLITVGSYTFLFDVEDMIRDSRIWFC